MMHGPKVAAEDEEATVEYPPGDAAYNIADLKMETDDILSGIKNDWTYQTFIFDPANPKEKYQLNIWQLKADFTSLQRGLAYWYGGTPNPDLAKLIYSYFGKGRKNHLITFVEFMDIVKHLK